MSKNYKKAQVWIARESQNQKFEFLLFKVIPKRGQGWHPVTGSIEKGETPFEGAKRETLEETGLDVNDSRWYDLGFSFQFKSQWGSAEEFAYGVLIEKQNQDKDFALKLDPKEHTDAKWVSFDEALKTVTFENQKKALCLFYDKLAYEKLTQK